MSTIQVALMPLATTVSAPALGRARPYIMHICWGRPSPSPALVAPSLFRRIAILLRHHPPLFWGRPPVAGRAGASPSLWATKAPQAPANGLQTAFGSMTEQSFP